MILFIIFDDYLPGFLPAFLDHFLMISDDLFLVKLEFDSDGAHSARRCQHFGANLISTILVLQKTATFGSAEIYRFSDDFSSRAVGCGKEPPQRLKYSRNKGENTCKTSGG